MGRDASLKHRGPGTAPGHGQRGAGLIEAMLALGLLSASTLGTLSAFTGAERGGHAAWLRLAAVDLAADAAEQIRALSPGTDWNASDWQAAAARLLPEGAASATRDAQGYHLSLRWKDRAADDAQSLTRDVLTEAAP